MRIVLQRDNFLKHVKLVTLGTEKKDALLSHIRISAEGGTVTFEATDFDVALRTREQADVQKPGVAVLPGAALQAILEAAYPQVPVTLTDEEPNLLPNQFVISCGTTRHRLMGLAPADYPRLNQEMPKPTWAFPVQTFLTLSKRSSYCMARAEGRVNLFGLFLIGTTDSLTAVATDGNRLALAKLQASEEDDVFAEPSEFGTPFQALVHRRGVSLVEKIFSHSSGMLRLAPMKTEMGFTDGTVELFARIIDESFPDYELVIPASCTAEVQCETAALQKTLKQLKPPKDSEASVHVKVEESQMLLESTLAEAVLPCTKSTEISVAFEINIRYLLETLAATKTSKITLKFLDATSPLIIGGGDQSLAVVMPVVPYG
jgi:DNA polymerase-3 subunit beta